MTRTEERLHHPGQRSLSRAAVALLALSSLSSAACTTVHYVPVQQLERLDGFREDQRSLFSKLDPRAPSPRTYSLIDMEGDTHSFDESSRLALEIRSRGGEDTIEERYRAITARPDFFIGLPRGSSNEIRVPMAAINRAGLRKFSAGKTVGLLAGIAGAALVTLIIIGLALPDNGGGGGDHDFD